MPDRSMYTKVHSDKLTERHKGCRIDHTIKEEQNAQAENTHMS